jgi:nitrate/TMAO reductase-like tetraheme cytochrome c subunit
VQICMRSFIRTLLSLAVIHWLTGIGVVLTTASAVVFLFLFFQRLDNPYAGIVVFLILPALFILGLALMPLGIFLASRRLGGFRAVINYLPSQQPRAMRFAWAFAFATLANVGILTAAAYQGVHYMDSRQFCGQTCHPVMQPQYVRFQASPHSRIPCVDCHIGEGASSFIKYKLAGVRQLVRFSTNTYSRPIPSAMDHLRPAHEICENCHSQKEPGRTRVKVIRHYDNDEKSTEKVTVLTMRIGKIHAAHDGIEYDRSEPAAQTIPIVRIGKKSYAVENASTTDSTRRMDCIDCHNRAGHNFETPESAVDQAIAAGRLDRSRPFARRDAVAALKSESGMEQQPETVRRIFSDNVFPQMMISWGAYANNIGHETFPGCFRCHDGQHATKSGDAVSQDCGTCHELVAVEEPTPKILKDLGLE